MKILAFETEVPGIPDEAFTPHLRAEARRAWEVYLAGVLRVLYFRQDRDAAVLVLECDTIAEASEVLGTLPLVRKGLIAFELVPLVPYPGFSRLFAADP